jgi:hypothetical protein
LLEISVVEVVAATRQLLHSHVAGHYRASGE